VRPFDLTPDLFEPLPAASNPFITEARQAAQEMLRVPPGPARCAKQKEIVACLKAATSHEVQGASDKGQGGVR
jgi:hypothetical protein